MIKLVMLLAIWLLVGLFAASQRGYFQNEPDDCASIGTVVVTAVAGPLNYFGANPKVDCELPQPSR